MGQTSVIQELIYLKEKNLQQMIEIEPRFLEKQKFSNPLKNIYYNLILEKI